MAREPLSVRPALSIRSAADPGRRIRQPVHSLGLDEPRPLRYPMAPAHGSLVLPLSRPVVDQGIEGHPDRRAIAPDIARRLVNGSGRMSPQDIVSAFLTACLRTNRILFGKD